MWRLIISDVNNVSMCYNLCLKIGIPKRTRDWRICKLTKIDLESSQNALTPIAILGDIQVEPN